MKGNKMFTRHYKTKQLEQKPVIHYGRVYQCYVANSVEEANAFMERNQDFGVIACAANNEIVYIAYHNDEGTPA